MKAEEKIQNHYNPRLKKYRDSFQILDWESREAQELRFDVLLDNVDLSGRSLLDVGCGCGDLYGYLKERGVDVAYTGIDILPGMVEKAKELNPQGRFVCGDLFGNQEILPGKFDVVFISGIFNLNLGNNRAFFDAALPVLHRKAGESLVINLLDEASPDRDEKYFYFNPSRVSRQIEALRPHVLVVKGYLQNDFTIIGSFKS